MSVAEIWNPQVKKSQVLRLRQSYKTRSIRESDKISTLCDGRLQPHVL